MTEGRVKQHVRKTKSGKTIVVKEHGRHDTRVKKPEIKKPVKKTIKKNILIKDTGLYNEHVKKLRELESKKGSKTQRFHTLKKIPETERSSSERLEFAKLRHSLGSIDTQILKEKRRVAAYKSKFPDIGEKKKSKPIPKKTIPKKPREIPKIKEKKPIGINGKVKELKTKRDTTSSAKDIKEINEKIDRLKGNFKEKPKKTPVEKKSKKKWVPPTSRKSTYTTPEEARKLDKEYKKTLKELKKMVEDLGGLANAKQNSEYVAKRAANIQRIRKYFKIVEEHKKSLETGEVAKETPKKVVKKLKTIKKPQTKEQKKADDFYNKLNNREAREVIQDWQKSGHKGSLTMFAWKRRQRMLKEQEEEDKTAAAKKPKKAPVNKRDELMKARRKRLDTQREASRDKEQGERLKNIQKYSERLLKETKKKPKVRDRKAILKEIAALRVDVKVSIKHGDKTNTTFLNAKIAKLMKETEKK